MVKHVEPNRLGGLQVGKSGKSGGTGKSIVCSKHLQWYIHIAHIVRIAHKKKSSHVCNSDDAHIHGIHTYMMTLLRDDVNQFNYILCCLSPAAMHTLTAASSL